MDELLLAWSNLLSMVAAAFSSLALLSPPGDRTQQTCRFSSSVNGQKDEVAPESTSELLGTSLVCSGNASAQDTDFPSPDSTSEIFYMGSRQEET